MSPKRGCEVALIVEAAFHRYFTNRFKRCCKCFGGSREPTAAEVTGYCRAKDRPEFASEQRAAHTDFGRESSIVVWYSEHLEL